MKTLKYNQLNENSLPEPLDGTKIPSNEYNVLKDNDAVTSKDTGHYHMVNKDSTNTSTQYNVEDNHPMHVHDIKNGKVLPAEDGHTHTI